MLLVSAKSITSLLLIRSPFREVEEGGGGWREVEVVCSEDL